MKLTSLSFSITGILCIIMAILTALEISPAFISSTNNLSTAFTTTIFWGGLAALLLLSGISFGVIAKSEL